MGENKKKCPSHAVWVSTSCLFTPKIYSYVIFLLWQSSQLSGAKLIVAVLSLLIIYSNAPLSPGLILLLGIDFLSLYQLASIENSDGSSAYILKKMEDALTWTNDENLLSYISLVKVYVSSSNDASSRA